MSWHWWIAELESDSKQVKHVRLSLIVLELNAGSFDEDAKSSNTALAEEDTGTLCERRRTTGHKSQDKCFHIHRGGGHDFCGSLYLPIVGKNRLFFVSCLVFRLAALSCCQISSGPIN